VRRLTRSALRPLAVVAVGAWLIGPLPGSTAPAPKAADRPASCTAPNKRMTLYAVQLKSSDGKVRLAYGRTPQTATIPGPTIVLTEGDCLAITLVNDVPADTLRKLRDDPRLGSHDPDMPLGVSLHVHGVKYTQSSDGTLPTGSWVAPGSVRTYIWYAAPLAATRGRVTSQGTAGYWWYHDHLVGTEHGTGGAASGLFGAVIVRRPGDVTPDRTYVVGMGPDSTINLRDFPDCGGTPSIAKASNTCYVAQEGELVEFAVMGFGDDFHTFHLHGHNWADNRTGILAGPEDQTRAIDNKTLGPADSFGFVIRAGEEVGAGHWMLHCHVQSHSDSGMTTFLHVLGEGAAPEAGHDHRA
jgi:FtsP/CotA-like multicopper oxidase with cupredoxin domain